MNLWRNLIAGLGVAALSLGAVACDTDADSTPAPTPDVADGQDHGGEHDGGEHDGGEHDGGPTPGACDPACAAGFACVEGVCEVNPDMFAKLWIQIDDSANKSYAEGDLFWKGSFAFDSETFVATPDNSWPGPYVPLWDDGPIDEGGHEPPGSTAGDSVWTCIALVMADPDNDITVEYGLENKDAEWLWSGPNGQVVIPAGSTDIIEAAGMTFEPFGTVDLMVTIDTAALQEDFLPFDAASDTIAFKSSAINWVETPMVDDGTKGDVAAGDGIYTFLLSEHLGAGQGLVKGGDTVEFVWVVSNVEYKDGNGDALPDGVAAKSGEFGGELADEDVVSVMGGLGGQNTAVIVGEDPPADGE